MTQNYILLTCTFASKSEYCKIIGIACVSNLKSEKIKHFTSLRKYNILYITFLSLLLALFAMFCLIAINVPIKDTYQILNKRI